MNYDEKKELIANAAKAVGFTGFRSKHGHWIITSPNGDRCEVCQDWQPFDSQTGAKNVEPSWADAIEYVWRPLHDDAEIFKMIVTLRLDIEFSNQAAKDVSVGRLFSAPEADDVFDAIRTSVLRAAAETGRAMP